ncbi:hypothetical protein ACFRQM_09385 [Streptomyces sp. NPDC056831]|uniref:hypothetical protein n=1 Tax=Streptomyces sp. NPDC056831 TaxID=3345954 RepID=UPI0036C1716E
MPHFAAPALPEGAIPVGALVTYHGSLTDLHGQQFKVIPCAWHCDRDTDDVDGAPDPCRLNADTPRFGLYAPATGQPAAEHVRAASITPATTTWPSDAVPFRVASYWYMASHTTHGGSSHARIVHFYRDGDTRGVPTAKTWCRLSAGPVSDLVRHLDGQARGRTPAA